eukprot:CAMPEP_0206491510 /NCGR_PEP_ID=MMETSP0324_2-20121206/45076_1 /ASSEMBLY_ACC=CAM_ASM_000836 /TAXON_ID=2866 /ORGANISM="Crypthecodinium cohnii, Strain Seligo" /LENGTH=314 /DNA_ID=CAMNT_0053972789 /DNA_START=21 /DNA_END=965 /DNA_ORIENTATION=+
MERVRILLRDPSEVEHSFCHSDTDDDCEDVDNSDQPPRMWPKSIIAVAGCAATVAAVLFLHGDPIHGDGAGRKGIGGRYRLLGEEPWWNEVPGVPSESSSKFLSSTSQAAQSEGLSLGPIAVTTTPIPAETTTTKDWFEQLGAGSGADVPNAPPASMHDGNVCGDDEEELEGLCYKKCSALTQGAYPIRTTAWTCCKEHPCTLTNQVHNVGICSGFDVAGDLEGHSACPHTAGACYQNEELFMGMCYKKCSLMEPTYPRRVGPATCCVSEDLSCAMPSNSKTSSALAVGGGSGETDSTAPTEPHHPVTQLTESM